MAQVGRLHHNLESQNKRSNSVAIRVGINGFGRIGRLVFRAICDQGLLGKEIDVVAVNDIVPADNLAYLLKFDSTQGRFPGTVTSEKSSPAAAEDDVLVVDGRKIKCLAVKDGPAAMPVEVAGRRSGRRIDRPVHRRHEGQGPPRSRREEGHHLGPGQERGRHPGAGRQRATSTIRPSTTSSRTQAARPTASPRWSTCC